MHLLKSVLECHSQLKLLVSWYYNQLIMQSSWIHSEHCKKLKRFPNVNFPISMSISQCQNWKWMPDRWPDSVAPLLKAWNCAAWNVAGISCLSFPGLKAFLSLFGYNSSPPPAMFTIGILGLAGMKLVFVITALCCCVLDFVTKTALIMHQCFDYCWTAPAQHQGFCFSHSAPSVSRLGQGRS